MLLVRKEFPSLQAIYTRQPVFCKLLPGDKRVLLLREEVSVSTRHVPEKLCAAHPKVASESKILARRDHLEQYFINSQISTTSQILGEFQKKTIFRICGRMAKTLTCLELSLYEGYGALHSLVL